MFQFQDNLLRCDKDDRSRVCPVLLTNFDKRDKMNDNILSRNFPDKNIPIILDYRGSYQVCRKYVDKNQTPCIDLKNDIDDPNNQNKIKNIENVYDPGKGYGLEYLRNVDIESNLHNLGLEQSKCPCRKYQQGQCILCLKENPVNIDDTNKNIKIDNRNECGINCLQPKVSDPRLLLNPTCDQQKVFNYRNQNEVYPQTAFNHKTNLTINKSSCIFDLPKQERYVSLSQPSQYFNKIEPDSPFCLQVGPKRDTSLLVDNLFNNYSKRSYINTRQNPNINKIQDKPVLRKNLTCI